MASKIFKLLPKYNIEPNSDLYTSYFAASCKAGNIDNALSIKKSMLEKGMKPTSNIYSLLTRAILKKDKNTDITEILNEMKTYSLSTTRIEIMAKKLKNEE